MKHPPLSDPKRYPSDPILAGRLGKARPAWNAFLALLKNSYPKLRSKWHYTHDGKNWRFKVSRHTTTVCWAAVQDKHFTVTFFLNTRAEELVRTSSLDNALKQGFLHPVQTNKFRFIRIEVRKKSDLNAVEELLNIKLKVRQMIS